MKNTPEIYLIGQRIKRKILMIIIIICFLCNMNYYLLCIKKNGILLWNIEILRKVVYKKVNFGLLTFFLDIKLFYFKVF